MLAQARRISISRPRLGSSVDVAGTGYTLAASDFLL